MPLFEQQGLFSARARRLHLLLESQSGWFPAEEPFWPLLKRHCLPHLTASVGGNTLGTNGTVASFWLRLESVARYDGRWYDMTSVRLRRLRIV